MHNLNQLVRSSTLVSKATSTLLDDIILTHSNELVSHSGVLDIGLSLHQLVFCTRKNKSQKLINTKLSKQNYTAENFCDKLKDVNFANYSDFADVNDAFVDFYYKLM